MGARIKGEGLRGNGAAVTFRESTKVLVERAGRLIWVFEIFPKRQKRKVLVWNGPTGKPAGWKVEAQGTATH